MPSDHNHQFTSKGAAVPIVDSRWSLPRTRDLFGDAVVSELERWYASDARTFPWRRNLTNVRNAIERGELVNDPYVILVSEVMLQQTQAARVAQILPGFLERFPTVNALASASRADVLRAWKGLGYNSRAIRLHASANEIVQKFGGEFPRDLLMLVSLSGIGQYTASAIACFAYGMQVPVVDVNIRRVLSRVFYRCYTADMRARELVIVRLDESIIPQGGSYWWHQALMDLGATICTARRPDCSSCPLNRLCLSAFPSSISLYSPTTRVEPHIAGVPRRIWRGRIVQLLREQSGDVMVGVAIDSLVGAQNDSAGTRIELIAVMQSLVRDGLLDARLTNVARNRVAEHAIDVESDPSSLGESTFISLRE